METNQQETVLYGGAFNPPTLAHEAILQACVDYAEPRSADIWVVPSASRSDKSIEVSRERRIEYCQALTRDVLHRAVRLDVEVGSLSSTELRRRIVAGERYDDIVGSHVHELLSLAR